jgi:hypothetical protein
MVQAVKDAAGNMRYINPLAITNYASVVGYPTHTLSYNTAGETLLDAEGTHPDSVDIANRPKVGYLVFEAKAMRPICSSATLAVWLPGL